MIIGAPRASRGKQRRLPYAFIASLKISDSVKVDRGSRASSAALFQHFHARGHIASAGARLGAKVSHDRVFVNATLPRASARAASTPGGMAVPWDARVGRAMDVALPHELNTKAQWELLRGVRPSIARHLWLGALREPAPSEYEGRPSQCPRTYFHDDPRGGRGRQFKAKIRALDDRKLGPVEVERIREMWELRCNRALRKAGMSEGVNRGSLKAQGIDRPATKHLGSKASHEPQWLPAAES